ncbi:MAG: OB-fold nucleic acid binding domain-containing protein [Candidatus Altiarchaeota archaeon]
MNVKDLQPNSSFDLLEVEVVSVEEPREFTNFRGSGRVANAMIKDDTGQVKLTLWNDQVDAVSVGQKLSIENGWVKEYRGELQVSTGKFGKLNVVE